LAERQDARGTPARSALLAHIAQQVEHFLGKEEVIGSNPIVSTIHLATDPKSGWVGSRGKSDTAKRVVINGKEREGNV
jgi:hypothetical protein